jgi:hypothetical protein
MTHCLATVAKDKSPKIRTALPLPTIHLSYKNEVNQSKTLGGVEWQRLCGRIIIKKKNMSKNNVFGKNCQIQLWEPYQVHNYKIMSTQELMNVLLTIILLYQTRCVRETRMPHAPSDI